MKLSEKNNEIHDLLGVFFIDLRTRNKLLNIINHLKEHGKTIDDFVDYANEMNEIHKNEIKIREKNKPSDGLKPITCPECKHPMFLRLVNIDAATKTGDNSKSVWICFNKDCMHTEYSEKTIEQWRTELTGR
uniref:Uncharacterized protein n=1 Tax=viral metagenome TaxID=1070528 RepID=A0A6M3L6Q6_9ZZZZ